VFGELAAAAHGLPSLPAEPAQRKTNCQVSSQSVIGILRFIQTASSHRNCQVSIETSQLPYRLSHFLTECQSFLIGTWHELVPAEPTPIELPCPGLPKQTARVRIKTVSTLIERLFSFHVRPLGSHTDCQDFRRDCLGSMSWSTYRGHGSHTILTASLECCITLDCQDFQ
jgi:hypothetical protein